MPPDDVWSNARPPMPQDLHYVDVDCDDDAGSGDAVGVHNTDPTRTYQSRREGICALESLLATETCAAAAADGHAPVPPAQSKPVAASSLAAAP